MADAKTCPHCGKPVPPTALGDLCPECLLKAGLATQTEGPGGAGPQGTKVVRPPPAPEEIAALFPQLEILKCLGRGGMGVVYKARQPRLNRLVALKILARDKEQDTRFTERFTREAQALARLNHPNIVAVHDFGEIGGHCYLVMEFVDGLNLRQLLQAGKMPPEQALTIVPKICEALQYAHDQGVVHRDIKPENILLDKSGRVKIADFGIAKMLGDEAGQQTLTGAKDAVGTPHYMAPEQIEKPLTVDHRADIYSLGVVFYEMLTGELPLGKFQPPSKKVQIDVRLDEVVLHALEKEPERRYQQAKQVKTDVETIAATVSGGSADRDDSIQPEAGKSVTAAQMEAVRKRLKIPARGLIAAAAFQLLFALALLLFAVPAVARENGNLVGLAVIGFTAVGFLIPTVVVFAGAINMVNLRRYTLAVVASVMAAVAGPGAILGLPFGIWACVELFRHEARAAFAANRLPTGPAATLDSGPLDFARSQVKGPAIGLVVTGVLDWVLMVLACIIAAFKSASGVFIWLPFLAMALSSCIIYAGLKFMQLERRAAVWLGSVLAMCVSPGNLIGLPLGIWALVVLNRREIRAAFEANRQQGNETMPTSGVPLFPISFGLVFRSHVALKIGRIGWVLGCLGALGFLGFIPGVSWLKGLFGFAGFFGLIGLAVVIEAVQRRREGVRLGKAPLASSAPDFDHFWRFIVVVFLVIPVLGLLGSLALQNIVKSRNAAQPYIKSDYIGQAWFPQGDSIEITSVGRTTNQMKVKGHYNLVSHDQALLALFTTTESDHSGPTPAATDRNEMHIAKGRGDFELVHSVIPASDAFWHPGLPHVSMYADGKPFAALYFGTKAEAAQEREASWITNAPPVSSQTEEDSGQIFAEQPPVVVETQPVSGARDVAPGIAEIRVRFSKPMADGSWSWSTAWQDSTPESIGEPRYGPDHRTCVLKVKLEPGRTYAWWLNSEKFHNFSDQAGRPAVPYLLIFQTKQN